MPKIKMKSPAESLTIRAAFKDYAIHKEALGVKEKTLETYWQQLHAISKHLDLDMTFAELTKKDLDMMIISMKRSGLAQNSISSYVRMLKAYLTWCNSEGFTRCNLPTYKQQEVVKGFYTDEELERLLKRPSPDCDFCEYRNWVIINFFLNCGCRASTVRNMRTQDVSLESRQAVFRHTKTGKVQVIPLCTKMVNILRSYISIRGGQDEEPLFCTEQGTMMTEYGLRLAIAKYNKSRGVKKTSLHLFRHTFARKYLLDCKGNAFMLQKLLGHSTLKMTRHYCAIYDADIAENFDQYSPLAQMNKTREKLIRK